MSKVFLGGTCNESTWTGELIPMLKIDYFDPVVDDWDEEAYQRELREREECDYCLYTITPVMVGVYSVAEVVDDSNKRPERAVLVLLREGDGVRFDDVRWKSLQKVGEMVKANGAQVFYSLEEAAAWMNG